MTRFAMRSLWRRKARTILTVLGIVIGIMALTVLGAMASRMNQQVDGAMEWTSETITVYPEGRGLLDEGSMSYFDRSKVDEVGAVPGVENAYVSLALSLDDGQRPGFVLPDTAMGVDLENPDVRVESLALAEGRNLEEGDQYKVVLGSTMADSLDAGLGDQVDLKGTEFEVVGILDSTLTSPDQMAFISLENAQEILQASTPALGIGDVIDTITVSAAQDAGEEELAGRIQEQVVGVNVITPAEAEEQISQMSLMFNAIVLGVALLALIVGSLSIINTMVMAVSERTREIGVKKAIGAETRSILGEVLLESGMIGFWGGAIGVSIGVALVLLFNNMTASSGVIIFALTPFVVVGPIVFATVLGTVAGLFPAFRAARLDPVAALKED